LIEVGHHLNSDIDIITGIKLNYYYTNITLFCLEGYCIINKDILRVEETDNELSANQEYNTY